MATSSEKEIKTNYPNEDGIIAETTTQKGHIMNLISQDCSKVLQREKAGVY